MISQLHTFESHWRGIAHGLGHSQCFNDLPIGMLSACDFAPQGMATTHLVHQRLHLSLLTSNNFLHSFYFPFVEPCNSDHFHHAIATATPWSRHRSAVNFDSSLCSRRCRCSRSCQLRLFLATPIDQQHQTPRQLLQLWTRGS